MDTKKLPKSVSKGLWAFVALLAIVLIGRHLVADQQQEERIETLEVQIAQLEARMERRATAAETTPAPAASNANAATAGNAKGTAAPKMNNGTPAPQPAAKPQATVAEKLTDDHKNAKFNHPIRLDLNTVDSLTLLRVPGIAARTAATILDYRKKLGGFYSPEQLRDKLTWEAAQNYLDEWCSQWFTADVSLIQPLRINSLSFREINRHPYISYEQTLALVRYRDKHKTIRSMAELEQLAEFDDTTLERLKHYLSFE